MSNSVEVRGTGTSGGFGGLLFIVFLVLKLTGVIAWSWWWVTAPLWIPVAILILCGAVAGGLFLVYRRREKKRAAAYRARREARGPVCR